MKLSIKNKILLLCKAILPAILCVVLIFFLQVYFDFQYILMFGVIIVLFNHGKTKHDFILTIFYSIILSFLVLISSMVVGKFLYLIKDELLINLFNDNILKRIHVIPKSIISPILMFYAYNLLFNMEKTIYFKIVKWSSVFTLIILGLTNLFFKNMYLFIFWQFIMALALQLILYQDELKNLFNERYSKR